MLISYKLGRQIIAKGKKAAEAFNEWHVMEIFFDATVKCDF